MANYYCQNSIDLLTAFLKIANHPNRSAVAAIHRKIMQYVDAEIRKMCREHFYFFVLYIWPEFVPGAHHKIICQYFDDVIHNRESRVMINLPPRSTKSELSCYLLVAYYMGMYPNRFIIQASNTQELAANFGRKVRNLMLTSEYQKIFPNVKLRNDSKAANRWETNYGGKYFAVGAGGTMLGKGAHLMVIDDPYSEQDALSGMTNPEAFDKVYNWYTSSVVSRLQPDTGAIVLLMSRWSKRDLCGRLLSDMQRSAEADRWRQVCFPAVLPDGSSFWPEWWPIEQLLAKRASLSNNMGVWYAQYMQEPQTSTFSIVPKDWWVEWEKKLPEFEFVVQSWDTAFSAKASANYSACTTWGVYKRGDDTRILILFDAYRGKLDFPDLKQKALLLFQKHKPHRFLIEARSTGQPLIQELRLIGIPVQEVVPTAHGGDKVARCSAVAPLFRSGVIYYVDRPDIREVINEFDSFPDGDFDDMVDSSVQAISEIRRLRLVDTPSDKRFDDDDNLDWVDVEEGYY